MRKPTQKRKDHEFSGGATLRNQFSLNIGNEPEWNCAINRQRDYSDPATPRYNTNLLGTPVGVLKRRTQQRDEDVAFEEFFQDDFLPLFRNLKIVVRNEALDPVPRQQVPDCGGYQLVLRGVADESAGRTQWLRLGWDHRGERFRGIGNWHGASFGELQILVDWPECAPDEFSSLTIPAKVTLNVEPRIGKGLALCARRKAATRAAQAQPATLHGVACNRDRSLLRPSREQQAGSQESGPFRSVLVGPLVAVSLG